MARRSVMKPVYVGDVGDTTPVVTTLKKPKQSSEELDNMDIHQLFAVAIECGLPVQKLIGIEDCTDHYDKVLLIGAMPEGFTLVEDCVYCNSCFQLFRKKRKTQL